MGNQNENKSFRVLRYILSFAFLVYFLACRIWRTHGQHTRKLSGQFRAARLRRSYGEYQAVETGLGWK